MKVNEWSLIFIKVHVLLLLNESTKCDIIDYNSFWKIHYMTFFPYKSIRDKVWPCRKIGHGQPKVISWTNFVVLEYPMLPANFQGLRLFGSREDCLRVFPYMGMAAILVMWPEPFEQTSIPPSHGKRSLKIWIWVTLDQGQWMTLTFDIHIGSCTHLDKCIYQLWHHRLQ